MSGHGSRRIGFWLVLVGAADNGWLGCTAPAYTVPNDTNSEESPSTHAASGSGTLLHRSSENPVGSGGTAASLSSAGSGAFAGTQPSAWTSGRSMTLGGQTSAALVERTPMSAGSGALAGGRQGAGESSAGGIREVGGREIRSESGASGCADPACASHSCREGWADCNGVLADGCEVNLASDSEHCGECAAACSGGAAASCSAGKCALACPTGYADCDASAANGCEINLATSREHCGGCNAPCPQTNHGTTICRAGACELGSCMEPYADCDGNRSNGCESSAETDALNCGGCGRACRLPHAESACNERSCAIAQCEQDWADCNGLVADGCEVHLLSSVAHCGACNDTCAPARGVGVCVQGKCSIDACQSGRADCNQLTRDGCEVDVTASVNHCGGCGFSCNASHGTPKCNASVCSIACSSGYGNCDGLASNGCETDTASSLEHCGGCDQPCGGKCRSGQCVVTPCSGICDEPVRYVIGSGPVTGISQKICHESHDADRTLETGSCGQFSAGRTLYVNGNPVWCGDGQPWNFAPGSRPSSRNGGFCFSDDKAGANGEYAWFYAW